MTETTPSEKCKCNKIIQEKFNKKDNLYFYFCDACKIGGKAKTSKEARREFITAVRAVREAHTQAQTPAPPALIKLESKNEMLSWTEKNFNLLIAESAQFIDKPATQRMIKKNVNYILNADLKKVWDSEEGRDSVVAALIESFEIGATLPEMGSIIPFGRVCEFVPSIEAYEHALTKGKNPPFKDITILPVYKNDIVEISQKDGDFSYEVKKIAFPRGEIVGIIVQAYDMKTDKMIGDAYDEGRLMEKAERHSQSYKYYLKDIAELRKAQSEGRDHIIKWDNKVYERDIISPYVGADKPEMLRKLAGKSFFGKYMKVRKAMAVSDEWDSEQEKRTITEDQIQEKILDHAINQFSGLESGDIQEAEIVETDAVWDDLEPVENIMDEKPQEKKPKQQTRLFESEEDL